MKSYKQAIKDHDEAIKSYHAVRDLYRVKLATDDELCAAQAKFKAATAKFDEAFAIASGF